MSGEDGGRPIDLLQQHDTHQLVRPGRRSEGEPETGLVGEGGGQTVRAADDEDGCRRSGIAPSSDLAGETFSGESVAFRIEQDDNCILWNDVGQRDRFFDAKGAVKYVICDEVIGEQTGISAADTGAAGEKDK